jgi:hypothetical protein
MIHAFADRGQNLAIGFSPRFSPTQPVLLSVTAAGHITRRDLRRGGEVLADHITETTVAAARLTIDDRVLLIEAPTLGGTERFGRIVDSRTGEETTTIDVSSDDGLRASNVVISQNGKEILMSWADDDGRPHGYSAANAADRIVFDTADRAWGVPLLLASRHGIYLYNQHATGGETAQFADARKRKRLSWRQPPARTIRTHIPARPAPRRQSRSFI